MAIDGAQRTARDERAALIRAARAYAKLNQEELAKALGQSPVTIKRIEAGAKDVSIEDLWAIADKCNVPREFLISGFETVPTELKRLHARFDVLTEVLTWDVAHAIGEGMAARLRDRGDDDVSA